MNKYKALLEVVEKLIADYDMMFFTIPKNQMLLSNHWDKLKPLLEMSSYLKGKLKDSFMENAAKAIETKRRNIENGKKDNSVEGEDSEKEEV